MAYTHSIGVVPIFVNAGAAILPAVLAAVASVVALLFKPRELVRACRQRPAVPAAVVGCAAVLSTSVWLFARRELPAKASLGSDEIAAAKTIDWTQIALDIINGGWQHKEEDAVFLSSPTAGDGRIFCATLEFGVAGQTGSVLCLDVNNGAVIWQTSGIGDDRFHPFFSSPALSEDRKYVVIGQGLHEDADCELLCLETATGKVHWRAKTPLHIESSPAVHGDMAVVGAGAIEGDDHKPTTHPGMVIAVRISDGRDLWRAQVNDPESSPAIASDGTVYIGSGFNGNAIVALRSETDEALQAKNLDRILWRTPAPCPITGNVILAKNVILVGGGNSDYVLADPHPAGIVMALNRFTGAVLWSADMPDAVLGPIAVDHGRALCPVRNGEVIALDMARGRVLWRTRVNQNVPVLAGVTVYGPWAYALSRDGVLARIRTADGGIAQHDWYQLNDPGKPGEKGLCFSTPLVIGRRLYVGTETGGLRCMQLSGGADDEAKRVAANLKRTDE